MYMSLLNVYKTDFRYRDMSGMEGDIVWDLCLKFGAGAGLIGVMLRFSTGRYRTSTHIHIFTTTNLCGIKMALQLYL